MRFSIFSAFALIAIAVRQMRRELGLDFNFFNFFLRPLLQNISQDKGGEVEFAVLKFVEC